jgi:hypothetical protein
MRISIGFELQTNEMSVAYEFLKPTESLPIFFHPEQFVMGKLQTHKSPMISLYGDSLSQPEDFKNATQFIKFLRDRYSSILLNDSYQIIVNSKINNMFNDAEFIVTYSKPTNVDIKDLFKYMKKKSRDAIQIIIEYISSHSTFIPIQTIKAKTKGTGRIKAQKNFPFQNFYRLSGEDQTHILFTRDGKKLDLTSFYFQTTLGVDLENVWDVMLSLSNMILDTPTIIKSEKQKVMKLKEIDTELDIHFPENRLKKNKLSRTLYLLFVYSFLQKKGTRKEYPFIIRHHFVELLKLLNKDQYDLFNTWLESSYPFLIQLSNKLYEAPSLITFREKQQNKNNNRFQQALMKQKILQSVDTVGTYPIKPEGLNTIILFEFRYWNALLNYDISKKKGTHEFISLHELD